MEKKLNMPKTDFSQRSESKEKEPKFVELWQNVYKERNYLNDGEEFKLHDGPPYANGEVHVGHVLNKVLKDSVVKQKLMSGFKVNYRPGFDCHGLPTELGVQKKYGQLQTLELRKKCEEWALKFVDRQTESFKSLGVFGDWDNPYLTMSKEYEHIQLKALYDLLKSNLVYLDNRPVYYSPSSRTVLAESELEYKERIDKSAYFTFDLEDGRKLLCWTTQPWTLLGNKAVCVNPNMVYHDVEFKGKVYVVSSRYELGEFKRSYLGSDLSGLFYFNKLTNSKGVVVCDEFVKEGSGTGLVHLCPAHGEEDFDVCKQFGLFGEDLTDVSGKLLDLNLFCLDDGSKWVLDNLGEQLFKSEEYVHQYPHDWRTNGPVYFKLTSQFFLDLVTLKNKSLEASKSVNFFKDRWSNRLSNMVKMRDRWCLSRQRKWGFPLAVFLKNDEVFLNDEVQDHLSKMFLKMGSNCWFELSANDLLPDKFKNLGLEKCEYTLDVWFDSGVSWLSVMNGQKSDLYLEGSDQMRGWFQSSLLTSVALTGDAPYKNVFTHGFVLDSEGRKMSKSMGNVVSPKDVQDKYNSDVLRLWVYSSNVTDDVVIGDDVLKSCGDYYFKLRNTLRYLLGNLYGYVDDNYSLDERDLNMIDLCDSSYKKCLLYYDSYNFKSVFDEVMLWVSEFSSKYLDNKTKSYLYEHDLNSYERLKSQKVILYFYEKLVRVLAPMVPFLAEDAYQHYQFKKKKSIFMESF